MPVNIDPIFTLTPQIGYGQISAANTNRDGTGTIVDILTGATYGTRIDKITVTATGTTTAGMVRLYLYTGSLTRLFMEVSVVAATPSATVQVFTQTVVFDHGVVLPTDWKLQASTHNAEVFNVFAMAGDY